MQLSNPKGVKATHRATVSLRPQYPRGQVYATRAVIVNKRICVPYLSEAH